MQSEFAPVPAPDIDCSRSRSRVRSGWSDLHTARRRILPEFLFHLEHQMRRTPRSSLPALRCDAFAAPCPPPARLAIIPLIGFAATAPPAQAVPPAPAEPLPAIKSLSIEPSPVALNASNRQQQLIVTAQPNAGPPIDVTHRC